MKKAHPPNASRSSGEGVWGGGASLREAASSPESPSLPRLFGREREGGAFSSEKAPPSQNLSILLVQRAVLLAGGVVGGLRVLGAEGGPAVGAIHLLGGNVVHRDGNAEHGAERNQLSAYVTVDRHTVVRTPIRHHTVYVAGTHPRPSSSGTNQFRGPSGIRALIQLRVHLLRTASPCSPPRFAASNQCRPPRSHAASSRASPPET